MSMFDSILCKFTFTPIPCPTPSELKDHVFSPCMYQTKSLECLLDYYIIDETGGLFKKENDSVREIKYTGEIIFYDFIMKGDNDYWVEYKAVFIEGKLFNLTLNKFETIDNKERLKNAKELNEYMHKRRILYQKWYIKYLYIYYKYLVRFLFNRWRRIKFPTSYTIEEWLLPL